jgi:hypothetical protein
VGFELLLWCLLALGAVLPPLLALCGVRLALAILSGALSPLLLGLVFLLSLRASWGAVAYHREDSRRIALGIASMLSAGTWAAGTALAVVVAVLRDWRRRRRARPA